MATPAAHSVPVRKRTSCRCAVDAGLAGHSVPPLRQRHRPACRPPARAPAGVHLFLGSRFRPKVWSVGLRQAMVPVTKRFVRSTGNELPWPARSRNGATTMRPGRRFRPATATRIRCGMSTMWAQSNRRCENGQQGKGDFQAADENTGITRVWPCLERKRTCLCNNPQDQHKQSLYHFGRCANLLQNRLFSVCSGCWPFSQRRFV